MRELPILMNGAMVRAVLEGRKTVTRRALKRQPEPCYHRLYEEQAGKVVPTRWTTDADGDWYCGVCGNGVDLCKGAPGVRGLRPPYRVGDRLYVRETTFKQAHPSELGMTEKDLPHTWDAACDRAGVVEYRADFTDLAALAAVDGRPWKPSIHMPKDRARIWLEVTAVRVEQLTAITDQQAHDEGVDNHMCAAAVGDGARMDELLPATVHGFAHLWDGLAKPGTRWADNPWVWVVEFKRIKTEVPHGG